jgi:hypothetical protein
MHERCAGTTGIRTATGVANDPVRFHNSSAGYAKYLVFPRMSMLHCAGSREHREDHLGDRKHTGLRQLAVAAVLAASFCSTYAQDTRGQAVNAAVADGLTTAMGLAAGAAEVNPVGPLMAMGMKAVLLRYAEGLPDTEQPAVYAVAASMWSGAAANNLCVTAAILSGGSFAPACVALGVAWGMKTWKESETERQFWEGCAMLRQYANEPAMQCVYTPPAGAMVAAAPRSPARPEELLLP